jgi:uncharacterized protein YdeI (YjbR/CyaY-like superfamily)
MIKRCVGSCVAWFVHQDQDFIDRGLLHVRSSGKFMQILRFETSSDLRRWLEKNHAATDGLWLRFFKKASGEKSVTYAEALDEALCFGWIDGQLKPHDKISWLQRFTPRRPKSLWSQSNTLHVERLSKAGVMTAAGLKAVEAAKADGRWQAAYSSPGKALPPDDFLKELAKNKKAKAFFESLNKTNIYSIVYRLQTARRPETRAKRLKIILAMMRQGKKFHP